VAEATIRPATEADIEPAWAILEAASLGPWYELGAEQFRDWWWPSYAGIWVAEKDAVLGYSATRGEMVEVYVLPESRRRGLGSRLLAPAEEAVEGPLIEATTRRDEPGAPPFLEGHGYTRAYETWVMQVELNNQIPRPTWPEGMTVRTFRLEEAHAVKQLLDLAYAEEPDFTNRPFEQWKTFMLGDPSFEAESWFVVEAPDGSLAAAALNWREGFVKDLVVHPAHRRRGVGAALLSHTFRHFGARGLDRVTLKTDSRNTSQAWRLYESMGMGKIRTLDDWQKRR
jgi:ribosomal protein S18 acetylase RimI-like enzyme